MKRRIGVVTGTRAEYGYLRPLLTAIQRNQNLELRLYVTGMHLLEELGYSVKEIESDGFKIAYKINIGAKLMQNQYDLATSIGTGILRFADALREDMPDIVLVFGDRIEPFAAAIAATSMNIPVGHIAGGDVGVGDIDHIMRHAITKLCHLHFTQSELSKERVKKLGEEEWRIFNVGALTLDTILSVDMLSKEKIKKKYNITKENYFLLSYHPTSTEWEEAREQIQLVLNEVAKAAKTQKMSIVITYPNDYPGSTSILDVFRDFARDYKDVRLLKNLPHLDYLSMMNNCSTFIGNSSSGIIEAPSLGVPYICIGTRQHGRERAANTIDVGYDGEMISKAIEKSLSDKKFMEIVARRESPYGDGRASSRIVDTLTNIKINRSLLQKKMTY